MKPLTKEEKLAIRKEVYGYAWQGIKILAVIGIAWILAVLL